MFRCFNCKYKIPVGYKVFMGMDNCFCSDNCRSKCLYFKCLNCNKHFTNYLVENICMKCKNLNFN